MSLEKNGDRRFTTAPKAERESRELSPEMVEMIRKLGLDVVAKEVAPPNMTARAFQSENLSQMSLR